MYFRIVVSFSLQDDLPDLNAVTRISNGRETITVASMFSLLYAGKCFVTENYGSII